MREVCQSFVLGRLSSNNFIFDKKCLPFGSGEQESKLKTLLNPVVFPKTCKYFAVLRSFKDLHRKIEFEANMNYDDHNQKVVLCKGTYLSLEKTTLFASHVLT